MALAEKASRTSPRGRPKPRIAPPIPAKSQIADFLATATEIGINLMPWQQTVGRYIEGMGADGRHLYREVAIIVARQNGKTELLVPLIVKRLLEGRRIMHTAQDRSLPREVFYRVAEIMWSKHASLFPRRNDRPTKPRYANGQEEIRLTNGGVYSIVAPTRGGARGPTRDLVIIDELREMDTWDFIAAAKPTMTVSPDPQMVYLSNAGQDDSIVLNALRLRADSDPALAYLEWSAAPDRAADDIAGWCESNPSIGYEPEGLGSTLETLRSEYRTARLEGTMALFETEHLCRWVSSMRERLVDDFSWVRCQGPLSTPAMSSLAVSMDPKGERASVALAWQQADGTIALRLLFNVTGHPIDTAALGTDVRDLARKLGVKRVGFDPQTDRELVKYFTKPKPEPIGGQLFANASAQFVNIVAATRLRWDDADAVSDDLTWTSRKADTETGSYQAVRAQDDRPITASLAAIRAVWLASGPKPATPKVM
jgi:hypothetical protein